MASPVPVRVSFRPQGGGDLPTGGMRVDATRTLGPALAAELDVEWGNTRRMLERVTDDVLEWRPHPKSWPLGQLATHLVDLPSWALLTLRADLLDLASPEAASMRPPIAHSVHELLERWAQNTATARAAIAGASDEHLAQPWSLRSGTQILLTQPRSAILRTMAINHGIHHRAQLGVYLRLRDIPVPGMYGPSADD